MNTKIIVLNITVAVFMVVAGLGLTTATATANHAAHAFNNCHVQTILPKC